MEVKEITEDDGFYTFQGYASTFGNVDHGNDVVERGAFRKTLMELSNKAPRVPDTNYSKIMPILWQHDMDEPIGSFI